MTNQIALRPSNRIEHDSRLVFGYLSSGSLAIRAAADGCAAASRKAH